MTTKITCKHFFLLLLFAFLIQFAQAQMVGTDNYIQGTSLEIGINGAGGFEGVNQATSAPPAGYHARDAFSPFGFIANPELDGWVEYDGDFYTPGTPENGWGIQIDSTGTTVSNNYVLTGSGFGTPSIPGSVTHTSHILDCYNTDWEGHDTVEGTNLHIKIDYLLHEPDLYYTTTVSITNNTSSTIPDMYYYRNLDPDNNEPISFDFTTTNTIVSEPTSGSCGLAHVSATSIVPSTQPMSYIGLAGVGSNFRVCYGGFSNRIAYDLWRGGLSSTGDFFTQTVGSSDFADEGISLSYRIQNLAPGATETFKFVVILSDSAASNAINNLLYLSYAGSAGSAGSPVSSCTPDTVRTCGAPVTVGVGGDAVGDFSWSWSPGTGLSSTTDPSVTANPATTTSYTITGTPVSSCATLPAIINVVVQVTPSEGNNPYITPVPIQCTDGSPFTLTVDSTGGVWGGPGVDSLGNFDPSIGVGTYLISYSTPGYCNTTDTVLINVISAAGATITQPPPLCIGSPATTLTAASPGGVWAGPGITDSISGIFDQNLLSAGNYNVTYTITGLCIARDTVTIRVDSVIVPVTGFSYLTSPICISNGTTPMPTGVAGFTSGGIYSSTAGLTLNSSTGAITLSSSTPGTYVVTYKVPATVCNPLVSSKDTVVIDPVIPPVTTFSYITPICITAPNPVPDTVAGFTTGGLFSCSNSLIVINDSTGVIDLSATPAGTYTVTYTVTGDNMLCKGSGTATFAITINPLPTIVASADVTMFIGASTTLLVSGGDSYVWSPPIGLSCTDCDSTIATPTETTDYCVKVTKLGCIDSTCRRVTIEIPCPGNRNLTVPNAFTPNGDGINDELCLEGWNDCVTNFEISIYDRWGEKVFESKDPEFCWNGIYKGKALDPAVFVYFIKASYIQSGATFDDPTNIFDVSRKGNISLVK